MGLFEEEKDGISIASDVAKVMGENLVAPDSLKGNRARCYAGDSQSWVQAPWLAREEVPRLLSIGPIKQRNKQSNTHYLRIYG